MKSKTLVVKQGTSVTTAEKLHSLQLQMAGLKKLEDELRGELFTNLKKQGIKSVQLEDGTRFTISERQTLKAAFNKDKEAMAWAEESFCVKVDTAKALKMLRRSLQPLPNFFTVSTSEYLTVRRKGEVEEDIN